MTSTDRPANPFDHLEDLDQFARDTKAARAAREEDEEGRDQPKADTRPRFPCIDCAGTGYYRGVRVYQDKEHCFACNGRGWFLKSREDRAAIRAKGAARKAARLQSAQEAFDAANPGLMAFLSGANTWSEFARALSDAYGKYGYLTEKQTEAAIRMRDKVAASKAARAVERETAKVAVDLSRIAAMFEKARATGLKAPRYFAEGVSLSLAASYGKNPGAIYVKDAESNEYLGKVMGGTFQPVRNAPERVGEALATIAANPTEAAQRYGKLTGRCSCCARTLTDPVSVANGIGPICAGKWGL